MTVSVLYIGHPATDRGKCLLMQLVTVIIFNIHMTGFGRFNVNMKITVVLFLSVLLVLLIIRFFALRKLSRLILFSDAAKIVKESQNMFSVVYSFTYHTRQSFVFCNMTFYYFFLLVFHRENLLPTFMMNNIFNDILY